jgi:soluble lytic murein transglycosylase-like protein
MSVIMKEEHDKIVKAIRRKAVIRNLILILVMAVGFSWSYVAKLETNLVTEAYQVAKVEFNSVLLKQDLLRLLRTKSLTVGQALDIVDVIMSQRDVPVALVLAVISQESEFKPYAISNKGAKGIMQIMPITFNVYSQSALLKGDRHVYDPEQNVRAGILCLKELWDRFGDWRMVLRAYQAGPENAGNKKFDWYVNAVIKKMEQYRR